MYYLEVMEHGKSTLFKVIMGHEDYNVVNGNIYFEGQNILELETEERANSGIFLTFQSPEEINGITLSDFIYFAKTANNDIIPRDLFDEVLYKEARRLGMKEGLERRYLNVGYSGGEKKKSEILQMIMINPKLALLDEIDSGLDIEATKDVQNALKRLQDNKKSIFLITHHTGIVDGIKPDYVHILKNGKIAKTGNSTLIKYVQENGFEEF